MEVIKVINRDELKSEYLELENGKIKRIEFLSDETKEIKTSEEKGTKYPVFIFKVLPFEEKEAVKLSLFKGQWREIVKQADEKAGVKLQTLQNCVFDVTKIVTVQEGKTIFDLKFKIVSTPIEKIAEDVKQENE